MFRKNDEHRQQRIFTTVDLLPESVQQNLKSSWAHVFYHEYFCCLDETVFSDLYSTKKSRPNTPVNILVGFETLKSGFGLSDEELYDHFLFDLKFRYALGLHNFDEGHFELRTIYNFRAALSEYEDKHKINLVRKATEKITDKQIEKFQIKTGLQRMDSTMVQSNIRRMSRLQLLVEIIHRFYRKLGEEEQKLNEALFSSYVKVDSLHYCYRVGRDGVETRMQQIGIDIAKMLDTFEDIYGEKKAYLDAKRVFSEHFRFEEKKIVIKEGKELNGGILQSPDDDEAAFRTKSGESSRGYVANITETCDNENKLQLITTVSTAPNTTDDQELLVSDIENLKNRMDIDELLTDAGYTGAVAAKAAEEHEVTQKVSAIKGRKKKETGDFGLEDFTIVKEEGGSIKELTCPQDQIGEVRSTGKENRYSAGFDGDVCEACSMKEICPAKKLKKKALRVLRFSTDDVRVVEQRKQVAETGKEVLNQRASVESTVRSIIHPFGGHLCKMPVRGQHRITTMTILSAAMVNIRRITGYLSAKEPPEPEKLGFALI